METPVPVICRDFLSLHQISSNLIGYFQDRKWRLLSCMHCVLSLIHCCYTVGKLRRVRSSPLWEWKQVSNIWSIMELGQERVDRFIGSFRRRFCGCWSRIKEIFAIVGTESPHYLEAFIIEKGNIQNCWDRELPREPRHWIHQIADIYFPWRKKLCSF